MKTVGKILGAAGFLLTASVPTQIATASSDIQKKIECIHMTPESILDHYKKTGEYKCATKSVVHFLLDLENEKKERMKEKNVS